eukprot:7212726-Alexandrium_andersonii.AAC.1
MHPSGAPMTSIEVALGAVQFQFRTPEACVGCSISGGATRSDRFDSLVGSIGTRCACHRVPP